MARDDRRRIYVVSVRLDRNETHEDCDARIVETLGPVLGKSDITVSVYEIVDDAFVSLGKRRVGGIERGHSRPRVPPAPPAVPSA